MEVPEELFSFDENEAISSENEKRSRQKTKRLQESEEQEDSLSPKKNNKKQELPIQQKNRETKDAEKGVKAKKSGNSKSKKPEAVPEQLNFLQMETNGSNGFPLIGQFESDEDPELSTPTSLQALPITTTMPPTAHSLAATQNPQTTTIIQGYNILHLCTCDVHAFFILYNYYFLTDYFLIESFSFIEIYFCCAWSFIKQ